MDLTKLEVGDKMAIKCYVSKVQDITDIEEVE